MPGRTKAAVGIVAAIVAAAAAAAGQALVVAPPTVAECARLQLKATPFQGSRLAATVFCLRPASIRTTASVSWTTCPTTPAEEPCAEGVVRVSFRSGTGSSGDPDSWGGENFPGAGLFALLGTGVYRCEARDIDRQIGRTVIRSYSKTLPLRDQAVGFAAVGKAVKVATSIHPGFRGPFGENASVRLGQADTCQLPGLPVGADPVRAVWPGKSVSVASLGGASIRVVNAGSFARSFPARPPEDYSPGVKVQETVQWSNSIVVVPALKRS